MNRADFQGLAQVRAQESQALLKLGHWDGAYYLAGYSIECALKACIAMKTGQYGVAGLKRMFEQQELKEPSFAANWPLICDWTEGDRYTTHSQQQAKDLIAAINDPDPEKGVLTWLAKHW